MEAGSDGPTVVVHSTDYGENAIMIIQSGLRVVEISSMHSEIPFVLVRPVSEILEALQSERLISRLHSGLARNPGLRRPPQLGISSLQCLCSTRVHRIFEYIRERLNSVSNPDKKPPQAWCIGADIAGGLPLYAAVDKFLDDPDASCLRQTILLYIPTIKALKLAMIRALRGKDPSDDCSRNMAQDPSTLCQLHQANQICALNLSTSDDECGHSLRSGVCRGQTIASSGVDVGADMAALLDTGNAQPAGG
ncbi:hypothetical protein B0J12DRAFT_757956 [Macrophomina phaseolina]|uniref:Uncharacterized protein n=1 Tax=Macrophomina phaseolina TaxID=35725 RepID=A0ABQ8G5M1_9PEZI|nr:hypothetical protein B0J12DRAFT_757956 [Macrophomina phaseolina]